SAKNGEVKRCASIDISFRPNSSAMAVDDALGSGKPDSGTGKLAHGMKSLKRAEEFFAVCLVEAGAVVAHKKAFCAFTIADADFYSRRRNLAGELPGVGKEILQQRSRESRIHVGPQIRRDFQIDGAARLRGDELAGNRSGDRAEI